MKTLFLIRHAKSSRSDPTLADQDRPLSDRGKRDAPQVGKRLAKRHVMFDLILSSPATRAVATARRIARQLDYRRRDIVVNDRLYPGAMDDLLDVIQKLDDKRERVMLVGHNPGLEQLAHRFSREITEMPTCAVAEFAFDTDSWSTVDRATLAKVLFERPGKL
jgi:phosphohistidine phosphatase